MSGMNVTYPHVTREKEYDNAVRNLSIAQQQRIESLAKEPKTDLEALDEYDRGLVECYRRAYPAL